MAKSPSKPKAPPRQASARQRSANKNSTSSPNKKSNNTAKGNPRKSKVPSFYYAVDPLKQQELLQLSGPRSNWFPDAEARISNLPDSLLIERFVAGPNDSPERELLFNCRTINSVRSKSTGEPYSWSTVGKPRPENGQKSVDRRKKLKELQKMIDESTEIDKITSSYFLSCDPPEGISLYRSMGWDKNPDADAEIRTTHHEPTDITIRELLVYADKYHRTRCTVCWSALTWGSISKHDCRDKTDFTVFCTPAVRIRPHPSDRTKNTDVNRTVPYPQFKPIRCSEWTSGATTRKKAPAAAANQADDADNAAGAGGKA